MDNPAKGGRGKKAPYESTHYRLPVPLKPIAEEMAANYRELITEYSDPQDPALIAAVISAMATPAAGIAPGGGGNQVAEDNKRTEELLQQYEQMKAEIEQLKGQIQNLKSTNNKDAIDKALVDFVESKKVSHKKQWSEKKEFTLNTRSWDAFRDFIKFIQLDSEKLQSFGDWKVGDKCTVKMPSGVIIPDGEIVSIQSRHKSCKVYWAETDSAVSADLTDLIKV